MRSTTSPRKQLKEIKYSRGNVSVNEHQGINDGTQNETDIGSIMNNVETRSGTTTRDDKVNDEDDGDDKNDKSDDVEQKNAWENPPRVLRTPSTQIQSMATVYHDMPGYVGYSQTPTSRGETTEERKERERQQRERDDRRKKEKKRLLFKERRFFNKTENRLEIYATAKNHELVTAKDGSRMTFELEVWIDCFEYMYILNGVYLLPFCFVELILFI